MMKSKKGNSTKDSNEVDKASPKTPKARIPKIGLKTTLFLHLLVFHLMLKTNMEYHFMMIKTTIRNWIVDWDNWSFNLSINKTKKDKRYFFPSKICLDMLCLKRTCTIIYIWVLPDCCQTSLGFQSYPKYPCWKNSMQHWG